MRKRIIATAALLLVLLIGAAMVAYPMFSVRYHESHKSIVLTEYQKAVSSAEDTTLQEERAAAQQYNEQLLLGVALGKDVPESLQYHDLLNISGDGMMGYVTIPAIDVTLPIYHGTGESTLEKGAGHMVGTSLPIGGIGTHAAISAHTGMATDKMFTDLGTLQTGDHFMLQVLGQELFYEIDQIKTVLPTQLNELKIDATKDYVTLLTCTPYGVNSHRLLVRGHRMEVTQEEIQEIIQEGGTAETENDSTWSAKYRQGILIGCAIVVAIGAGVTIALLAKRKRERK